MRVASLAAISSFRPMLRMVSIIPGMEKAEPMRRFVTGMAKTRFTPATGEATLSGVFVETEDRTGKALQVRMIRQGGRLEQAAP